MPAFTYLSDSEAQKFSTVPEDKDCDELLQELRKLSGEGWVIGRSKHVAVHTNFFKRIFCKPPEPVTIYTLYFPCRGEWQVMNLVTPQGGSNFYPSGQSREDVMNFMLGYIAGIAMVSSNV